MTRKIESLTAPHVLAYDYTRSLGPVLQAFFTALRDGRIVGQRTASGRVIVPPLGYDPDTGEEASAIVDVGTSGEVTTWTWVTQPRSKHPLSRPFAWALIRLDGADTAMLHAVDAGSEERMATGMRVRARWAAERQGSIHDIACFEPEDAS